MTTSKQQRSNKRIDEQQTAAKSKAIADDGLQRSHLTDGQYERLSELFMLLIKLKSTLRFDDAA